MLKDKIAILILFLLILPALWSLFVPGFFLSDDGEWMVIRFSAFYEDLASGQFPVRFLSRLNNGFGYPVANFLYPLFMYIGSPIHFLGASFQETIKILMGASLMLSGLFTFFWLRKFFGQAASLVGALVYSLFPYHLWDLYKRGSVGELLALSIVPFILWQIERRNLTFVSLGIGALIVSHNTLAILFLPVLILYMALNTNLKFMVLTVLLGLGLSSFFSLPAINDIKYTAFTNTTVSNFSDYFVNRNFNLLGLISPAIIILTASLIKRDKNLLLFSGVTLFSVFLALDLSLYIWNFISPFVQFPFRFLSLVMLGLSFIAAFSLNKLRGKTLNITFVAIILLIFWSAKDFLSPIKSLNYQDTYYSTNQDTTTVKKEYMPKWVKNLPTTYSAKVEVTKGNLKIENLKVKPNKVAFDAIGEGVVKVNTVYFPGWKVFLNDKEIEIDYEENGLILFNVKNGNNKVEVKFEETNLRLFADLISILSLGLVIGWLRFK